MTLIYWRIIHTIGHRLTKVNLAAGSAPKAERPSPSCSLRSSSYRCRPHMSQRARLQE